MVEGLSSTFGDTITEQGLFLEKNQ